MDADGPRERRGVLEKYDEDYTGEEGRNEVCIKSILPFLHLNFANSN